MSKMMAKKAEDCKILLSMLSSQTFPSLVCRLNAPNFFTLPEYDGTVYESPTFEFADATWYFRLYSHLTWQREDGGNEEDCRCFIVSLVRYSNSAILQQMLFYSVTLLDGNDKEYDCQCHETAIGQNQVEYERAFFNNIDSSFDRRETLCLIIQLLEEKSFDAAKRLNIMNGETSMEMTNEERNCNVTLKLSKGKNISSDLYTLKVPNFFLLPEYNDGAVFESGSFTFANASWCFQFKAPARVKTPHDFYSNENYFPVYLKRLHSEIPHQRIFHSCSLIKGDYEDQRNVGTKVFNENRNIDSLAFYWNKKSYFDRCDSLTVMVRLFCGKPTEIQVDKHAEMLLQDLKTLFLTGKNHDLTLDVDGKEFRVHRSILMARSPVFEAMLSHNMAEKKDGFVSVPDCDALAMEQFLYYVYTGEVDNLNHENVVGLYYTADKYNVTLLKEKLTEFLKKSLSPSCFFGIMEIASHHSDTELLECATEYFVNHTEDILCTKEWMSFMESNPVAAEELLNKIT